MYIPSARVYCSLLNILVSKNCHSNTSLTPSIYGLINHCMPLGDLMSDGV